LYVDVHGSRFANCSGDNVFGELNRRPNAARFRWRDVKTRTRRLAKDSNLNGGLVDPGPSKRCGTVSGDDDERYSGVMRLQHTGVEIRDGRARRSENRDGSLRLDCNSKSKERCGAFVNNDMEINQLSVGKSGSDER
jgi:hypothetical protein